MIAEANMPYIRDRQTSKSSQQCDANFSNDSQSQATHIGRISTVNPECLSPISEAYARWHPFKVEHMMTNIQMKGKEAMSV